MQYLLLIYDDETGGAAVDREAMYAEYRSFTEQLVAAGALRGANELQPSSTATTVSVRDGETLVTDGPFAETKEVLGGYYLIDVATLDEALEWAAKIPTARLGRIEVRPVVTRTAEVAS
ncbi:MAG TPA: YciI family protein [Gaiellaceae bacterium]|nr:YciI family protein [Gaiellaceae bacterium]